MKKLLFITTLLLAFLPQVRAQKAALSTNLVEYANLLTLNAEGSYAVGRHWSAVAGFRYNPFSYGGEGEEFRNRQRSFSAGARFWPWHVYSGWWFGGKLQFQEYNTGGISSKKTNEGERYGAGLAGGYTHMLLRCLNLEFGIGLWGGMDDYTTYDCPTCGLTEDKGRKFFLRPDDVIVGLSYIF